MKNAGSIIDLEKDPRNELRIDVSFTRAKLFQSLMKNVPKMFPKEMLDLELVNEEGTQEIFLVIKKTNEEIKKKKEVKKVREERYLELQRFIHAKTLNHE